MAGTATNHDGRSSALTAPNGEAQEELLRSALMQAGLLEDDVAYVEAHGTGTKLGDPVEVGALSRVYGQGRNAQRPLLIGSAKTNLGHLEAAAGLAGLVKVVLAMHHGQLPPSLHFTQPNPNIDWEHIAVVTRPTPWRGRRVAGVSSFGFSGTNAHVIVEQLPSNAEPVCAPRREQEVLRVSAKSAAALRLNVARWVAYLDGTRESLADISYSAARHRSVFDHGVAIVARDAAQAKEKLEAFLRGEAVERVIDDLAPPTSGKRVALPSYAFDHQRAWPSADHAAAEGFALGWRKATTARLDCDELIVVGMAGETTRALLGGAAARGIGASEAAVSQLRGRLSQRDKTVAVVCVIDVPFIADDTNGDDVQRCAEALLAALGALGREAVRAPAATRWVWLLRDAWAVGQTRSVLAGLAFGFVQSLRAENELVTHLVLSVEAAAGAAVAARAVLEHGGVDGVVSWRDGQAFSPHYEPAATSGATPLIGSNETYVVSGGLGALGLITAEALIERGARHLILLSRSTGTLAATERVAALRARARVEVLSCDVSRADQAQAVFERARREWPKVAGVVHAAGVLSDGLLVNLSADDNARVLRPKVAGTWNLLSFKPKDAWCLCYSSLLGSLGNLGQTNYAAANAFIDALARAAGREHRLRVAAFGAVAGAGMFARNGIAQNQWLTPIGARPAIARALQLGDGEHAIIASRRDFAPRAYQSASAAPSTLPRAELQQAVTAEVAAALGRAAAEVASDAPLMELGVDSLHAVEVCNRLRRRYGWNLPATLTLDYPTVDAIVDFMRGESGRRDARNKPSHPTEAIAVIGIGVRLPGDDLSDPASLWRFLVAGRSAVGAVPPGRWDPTRFGATDGMRAAIGFGSFIDGVDQFDANLFAISAAEATAMDPQQRILLETTHRAFEDAGIGSQALKGSNTGVFVGIYYHDYSRILAAAGEQSVYTQLGTLQSVAAGRIAYLYGCNGPAMVLDTACSSSLTAVHLASQSLRQGECDLALAAGVQLNLLGDVALGVARLNVLSPSGACHTFDDAADGFVRGEGCGVVVLKRLSDAKRDGDRIYAVVRGSAVNQDGRSSALSAPNGPAQQAVLERALEDAGVAPNAVHCLEAHGTGTKLGDPVELQAANAVYGQNRSPSEPLFVSSIKANLGHLEAAAGIVSFIKAALSLHNEALPPHIGMNVPNRYIPWRDMKVIVPQRTTAWRRNPRKPRFAAVSSFGISGTNAHVILEEAPPARGQPRAAIAQHVFSRQRYWPNVEPLVSSTIGERLGRHALAGRRVTLPSGQLLHIVEIGPELQPYLADHRVYGRVVVAGAFYVSVMLAVGESVWPASALELRDIEFTKAVMFDAPDTRLELRVLLSPKDGGFDASVQTLREGEITVHATGHMTRAQQPELPAVTVEQLRRDASRLEAMRAQFVAKQARTSVDYGPSWQWLEELGSAGRASFAHLRPPNQVAVEDAPLPAGLIDNSLAMGIYAAQFPDDVPRLPFAIARVQWFGRAATPSWALSTPRGAIDPQAQSIKADILLWSEAGEPLARIDGFTALRAPRERLLAAELPAELLYEQRWRAAERSAPRAASVAYLVVSDEHDAGARYVSAFAAHGARATNVDSASLAAKLGTEPVCVVWLVPPADEQNDSIAGTAEARLRRTLQPLLDAAQTLADRSAVTLTVVTQQAQPLDGNRVRPWHGAVWGMVRVLATEHPELGVRLIDVDDSVARCDALVAEVLSDSDEDEVALIAQGRYVPRVVRQRAPKRRSPAIDFSQGAHLVSGGLGAIGVEVGAWLAQQGAKDIVLLGRSPPNDEAQAAIARMSNAGARVTVERGDVTDEAALRGVVERTRARAGRIATVMHAAGVLRDATLIEQRWQTFWEVLAPKVVGAELLQALVPEATYLGLFGSIASVIGSGGQANYAAANAYLAALAHRSAGVQTLNWWAWGEAGMAAKLGRRSQRPLSMKTGLETLATAMQSGAPELSVITIAPAFQQAKWRELVAPPVAAGEAPDLAARLRELDDPASELEAIVQQTVQVALGGSKPIGRDQPLMALGVDSLMALELRSRLGRLIGRNLPSTFVFDYPTIAALTKALLAMVLPAKPKDAPPLAAPVAPAAELPSQDEARAAILAEYESLLAEDGTPTDARK